MTVTVWYLEQTSAPDTESLPTVSAGQSPLLTVPRIFSPTIRHYRWLFESVGGPWNWTSRKLLDDEQLLRILEDPQVEVFQLEVDSQLAGFAELDRRRADEVELKFFGLLPQFTGQGLGTRFLVLILQQAWKTQPRRVWLHTCSNDHPAAFRLYTAAGFGCYREELEPPSPGA